MIFEHKSVLLEETISSLNIKENGIYVDGTLGGGGHAFYLCSKLKNGKLIGIDQDKDAILASKNRLSFYDNTKFEIVRDNYSNIKNILENLNISKVDGIYLDLGVSSYQLDTVDRGFSYRYDAPLDMRMDDRKDITAKDIVNTYSEMDLYRLIKNYGEDRFAKNIAKHIVLYRQKKEIETTLELSSIISSAIPMKIQVSSGHPAKRTFQALRIELNEELKVLENSIDTMIDLLNVGSRLAIISFHSLEDRIVKNMFKKNANPCTCPPNFPICVCNKKSKGKIITKKPILPSEAEILENPRSKSAKLRVFERA